MRYSHLSYWTSFEIVLTRQLTHQLRRKPLIISFSKLVINYKSLIYGRAMSKFKNGYRLSCSKLWARCFRDQTYHAAVNTTNGVESQNKLLKYSYLPRKKNIISRLGTILYEDFNHDIHHKYLFLNYKTQPSYRTYNRIVLFQVFCMEGLVM